ncbi:hypothetical protein FF1_011815 [Malus domestica]
MQMKIEIVSEDQCKPSSPIPDNLKSYKLSLLDQIAPMFYVPVILFYSAPENIDDTTIVDKLKNSLSETTIVDDTTIDDTNIYDDALSGRKIQVGGPSSISSGKVKNEAVSRKAFAMQDKLWSIYAAGNTVPIPFLRATDISPIALLSDNVLGGMHQDNSGSVAVEALQELFTGDGQSKKGRRGQNEMPLPPCVYKRLFTSSTLMNLAQALAYHKMCYEDMPLQEMQATQEQQTIQNFFSVKMWFFVKMNSTENFLLKFPFIFHHAKAKHAQLSMIFFFS